MENKNRLTVNDSPEIGKLRYETYKGVLSKYKKAMEVGCYLEAITLMESIIFDRLASIVNEISGKDIPERMSFGKLIEKTRDIEFLSPYTEGLIKWKDNRNSALHAMAKSLLPRFEEKYNVTKEVAEIGYELFREVDKAIYKYRHNKYSK